MMFEQNFVEYGGERIDFETRQIAGRKTLSIEVHPNMRVVVRSPEDCDIETVRGKVMKRAVWIKRQLRYFQKFQPRTPDRQYLSGETHTYLGRRYRLKIEIGPIRGVKASRGFLLIQTPKRSREEVQSVLLAWYRERAKLIFSDQLAKAVANLGRRIDELPRLAVRGMRTRWGSMSHAGLLTMNVQLVQAPLACIEYVIAHELCHLTVKNHGAKFQQLLSKSIPDWQKRKERLEQVLL